MPSAAWWCIAESRPGLISSATETDRYERYVRLLKEAADVIETDLPREVGKLLYGESNIPVSRQRFLKRLPLADQNR